MIKKQKVTIKDIAHAFSLSPATVSLVLNDKWKSSGIKPETAEKIINFASESGYVVNSQARALRLKHNNLIGMIVPTYRNRFYASLTEVLEMEAKKQGWHAITMNANHNAQDEYHALQSLLSLNIQKIVLAGVSSPEPLNNLCQKLNIQVVNVDTPHMPIASIVSDNAYGAEQLTLALLKGVDKKAYGQTPLDYIYFMGGTHDSYTTTKRIEGFREAHHKLGFPFALEQILLCPYSAEGSYKTFKELTHKLGDIPLGFFSNSLYSLEGMALFLKENPSLYKKILSRHMGCFDWHPFANFLPFNMHIIRQPIEKIIAESINILLKNKPAEPKLITIKPQLIKTGGIYERTDEYSRS